MENEKQIGDCVECEHWEPIWPSESLVMTGSCHVDAANVTKIVYDHHCGKFELWSHES